MMILLTGATGFIGWEVLKRLLARGETVRVLVRRETLERPGRGQEIKQMDGVDVVGGDLTDSQKLSAAHEGVEVVYHLAWHWPRNGSEPNGEFRVNLEVTEQLLQACVKHKVRRLVYASTTAVYGATADRRGWPVTEETPLFEGSYGSGYISTKVAIERMIQRVAKASDLEYVILRPSAVYGIGSFQADWLAQQARQGPEQGRPGWHRTGSQMVHVKDAAEAFVLAGTRPEAAGREFNIAGNEVVTIAEMIQMLRGRTSGNDRGMPRWFQGQREVRQRYDTTKAQVFLGFTPRVSLSDGLAEIAAALPASNAEGRQTTSPVARWASTSVAERYDQRSDLGLLDDYFENSDFWNFGLWEAGVNSPRIACENLLEKLLSFIPEKEGTILDVGCGKGASTRYLLKYYKPDHVTGVDVSEKSLATCRKNAPGVALRVMDAVNLEFPDGSFDNILCMSSASYFNTRAKFLCEAHRVLKPRGCLVLSENIQRVMAQDPQERSVQTANYVRNSEEYREICLRAGFEEVMAKDITRESWGEFSQHLAAYLEKARQRGTINFRRYTMIRAWLNQAVLQTEFCVLAVCRKS